MLDTGGRSMKEQTHGLLERIRRYAMQEGSVEGRGTWLRQQGEMRFAPDRPWMPFEAEEWFEGSGIDFRWRARVRMAPIVSAQVVDSFEGGRCACQPPTRREFRTRLAGPLPLRRRCA
jgi:hypothetical protein